MLIKALEIEEGGKTGVDDLMIGRYGLILCINVLFMKNLKILKHLLHISVCFEMFL